jgi:hypothetical protein
MEKNKKTRISRIGSFLANICYQRRCTIDRIIPYTENKPPVEPESSNSSKVGIGSHSDKKSSHEALKDEKVICCQNITITI